MSANDNNGRFLIPTLSGNMEVVTEEGLRGARADTIILDELTGSMQMMSTPNEIQSWFDYTTNVINSSSLSLWRQVMEPRPLVIEEGNQEMRWMFDAITPRMQPQIFLSPQIYYEVVQLTRQENSPRVIKVKTQEKVYEMKDSPQEFLTINQLYEGLQESLKDDEQKKLLDEYKHFVDEAKTKVLSVWELFKVEYPTLKNRQTKKFLSRLLYSRGTIFVNAFGGRFFSTYQMNRILYLEISLNQGRAPNLRINTKNWTCELTTR